MANLEGTGLNCTATLGADIIGTPATFTLSGMSASWPTSGLVHVNISDTEEIAGTISGSTITVTTRAVEPIGAFSTAQNHTAGDSVKLVFSYAAAKNLFPWRADQQTPSAAASMTFAAIPQTGTHLQILYSVRSDNAVANNDLYLQLNGDTTATYDSERQLTNAATITAAEFLAQTQMVIGYSPGTSATANYFARGNIWIPDYTSTVRDKVAICESTLKIGNATTQVYKLSAAGTWRTTSAAITSILMKGNAGNITGAFTLMIWP